MANIKSTFNDFLDAFCARKLDAASSLLVDDFEFVGPLAQAKSKAEFVEKMRPLLPIVTGYRTLAQMAEGDDVCSLYEFCVETPKGAGAIPMVEWTTFRGDKLARSRVLFNTPELMALIS